MALVAYWLIVAGLIGGLIAAPFGTIDWFNILAGTCAKWIGMAHGVSNVVTLLLFGVSWWPRVDNEVTPDVVARVVLFAGLACHCLRLGWVANWSAGWVCRFTTART